MKENMWYTDIFFLSMLSNNLLLYRPHHKIIASEEI